MSSEEDGAKMVSKATPVTMVQQSLEAAKLNDSLVAIGTTDLESKGQHLCQLSFLMLA